MFHRGVKVFKGYLLIPIAFQGMKGEDILGIYWDHSLLQAWNALLPVVGGKRGKRLRVFSAVFKATGWP